MSKMHSNTMQRSASLSCLREEYKYVAAIVNPLSGERAASDYVYQSLCQELGHHRVLRLTKEVFADTRPIKNLILEFATIRVEEGEVGSDGVRRHRHRLPSTRQSTSPSRRAMSTAPAATATDSSTPLLGASADPNGAADWGSVTTEAAKNNNTTQAAGSTEELPVVHGDDLYESAHHTTAQSNKNKDFSRNASSSSSATHQPAIDGSIDQLTPCCSPGSSSSSSQLPRGIVIVAGGDGTVSFVMQVLDQLSAELIAKEEQEHEDILEADQQSEAATTQVELAQKSAQSDPPLKTEDGSIDLTESESEDSTARQATPGLGGGEEEDLRPSNHQLISSPLSDSAPPAMMMVGASSDAEEPSFSLPAPTTQAVSPPAPTTSTTQEQHAAVRNISSVPTLPAVAVIAMGTGNDLSNWLGFGLGYTKYKCQPFGACCCCMASCSGKHANSGRPRNCCVNSVEDAVASLVTAMTQPTHNSKKPQQQQIDATATTSVNNSCRVVQFDRWSTRVVPLSVVYTAVCALRSAGLSSSRERGGGDDNDNGAINNPNAASTLSSASSCPHLLRLQSLSDMSMDLTTTDSTNGGAAPPSPPTKEMLLKGLEKLVNKNYTHIAMNYFSFGMDAFIATTFDQLRKAYPGIFQYRLVNKMVYGNLGVYGWQKCKRLDPYIKALEVGVNTTTSSAHRSSAQPHPQHLKSATFPAKTKAFVAANVGSYSGGVKLWDPDSSVAKNKYLIGSSTKNKPSSSRVTAPLVTGASVSDCRLEVQGVGGMVEMGLLQLKVTSADKVAQTSTMRTVLGMPKALPTTASASKSVKKTSDKYREIGVPIVATRDPEVSLEELTAVLPTIVAMEITDELLIAVRTQLNHYYRRDSPNLPAPTPKFNPPIAFQVDGEPSGTIPEPSIVEISPYNKPMFVIARNGIQI